MGTTRLFQIAAIVGIGCSLMRMVARSSPPTRPVRNAGPSQMSQPPREWDMTDERADESFPASDPPGTY